MMLREVVELLEAEKPCGTEVSAGIHRLEPKPLPNFVFKITFSKRKPQTFRLLNGV